MDKQRLDVGLVQAVRAESFGEPGHRTFRLLAETASGNISLWLEKEQLAMLGSAIDELLERVPETQGHIADSEAGADFAGDLEVRPGALAVAYDSSHDGFRVRAEELEAPLGITTLEFLASRSQFSAVSEQIDEIVAAGRPRCVLCGRPLSGEPHFCPPSNGHARTTTD